MAYVPSATRTPEPSVPFQPIAPAVPATSVHDRRIVEPRSRRANPVIRSEAVHAIRVVSAWPSPFGENEAGVAVPARTAGVRSTRTVHDRVVRLPAWSRTVRVRRYVPSGTTAPALVRPLQVVRAVPPDPLRVATTGPTVEPDRGAAANDHASAPVALSATVTVSRIPSPLGELSEPLEDEPVTTGATRSIVTPYRARAVDRKVVPGFANVASPAVPTRLTR